MQFCTECAETSLAMFSRKPANLEPPPLNHIYHEPKPGADPSLGVTYQFNEVPTLINKHTQVDMKIKYMVQMQTNRRHEDLFHKI